MFWWSDEMGKRKRAADCEGRAWNCAEAERMRAEGRPLAEVAADFGLPEEVVLSRLRVRAESLDILQVDEGIRLYDSGLDLGTVAGTLGVSVATVLCEFSYRKHPLRAPLDWDLELATRMYGRYVGVERVGKAFGRCGQYVSKRFREANVAIKSGSEAQRGTYRAQPRDYSLNERAFDLPLTPEACYWMGLLADGNVTGDARGLSDTVRLTLQAGDADSVEGFRTFLGAGNEVRHKPRRQASHQDYVVFAVTSVRLAHNLMLHGITPRKSLTICVSDVLARSADFWRGYLDANGEYKFYPRGDNKPVSHLNLSTGSPRLIQQYVDFVESAIGERLNIGHYVENGYSAVACAATAQKIVRVLHQGDGPRMQRKWETAQKMLAVDYSESERRREVWESLSMERLKELYDEHGDWNAVSRFLGVKRATLQFHMKTRNLYPPGTTKADEQRRLAELYDPVRLQALMDEEGDMKSVAARLGVNEFAFYAQLRRRGIKLVRPSKA